MDEKEIFFVIKGTILLSFSPENNLEFNEKAIKVLKVLNLSCLLLKNILSQEKSLVKLRFSVVIQEKYLQKVKILALFFVLEEQIS